MIISTTSQQQQNLRILDTLSFVKEINYFQAELPEIQHEENTSPFWLFIHFLYSATIFF